MLVIQQICVLLITYLFFRLLWFIMVINKHHKLHTLLGSIFMIDKQKNQKETTLRERSCNFNIKILAQAKHSEVCL